MGGDATQSAAAQLARRHRIPFVPIPTGFGNLFAGVFGYPSSVRGAARLLDEGAADGFILGFPVLSQGLDDFIAHVIPVLEARGRYQRTLPGHTLRDHLGLPRKASRYAQADADAATAPEKKVA